MLPNPFQQSDCNEGRDMNIEMRWTIRRRTVITQSFGLYEKKRRAMQQIETDEEKNVRMQSI